MNVFFRPKLWNHFHTATTFCKRFLISPSYYCKDEWASRLSHVAFNNTTARDIGLKILQKVSANESVSYFDRDVFYNKLHELDVTSLDFIERVIKSYMTTQESVDIIDSGCHAVIRAYIDFQEEDRILSLLNSRSETGIFVDGISATLLIDSFASKQEWGRASEVAWELRLQEYFSNVDFSVLAYSISLLSCLKAITSRHFIDQPIPKVEDDSEIEYKFVPYVRNPNYDNFFDITRLRLKMGYTMLNLAEAISNKTAPFMQLSSVWIVMEPAIPSLCKTMQLFGLALSEQCQLLSNELKQIQDNNFLQFAGLSKSTIALLMEITESSISRPDNSTLEKGMPIQPTVSEVKTALNELKRLDNMSNGVQNDFFEQAERLLYNGILQNDECINREIDSVKQLYRRWMNERDQVWQDYLKAKESDHILQSAKQTLRNLLDEEERLSYFRHSPQIDRSAWLAPRTQTESKWSRLKEWKKDIKEYQERNKKYRDAS